ncbi:MAG: DUF3098 domain-containing protein [Chlorobi bacterium]|nr:DUF3098 domain-containing protein [Chlorobiota bacterium]
MAKKVQQPAYTPLFGKENYKWFLIGLALIILGFALMAGGGDMGPHKFDESIFSFRRIRLAPALVWLGFLTEIYAIMRRPAKK